MVTHFVLAKAEDVACVVSYTDYPASYELDPERELLQTRDGLVRGAGALLVTSRPFQYAITSARTVSALEFSAVSGPATYHGILAIVDRRLYTWTIIAPSAFAQGPDADRFLRSFQLVPASSPSAMQRS